MSAAPGAGSCPPLPCLLDLGPQHLVPVDQVGRGHYTPMIARLVRNEAEDPAVGTAAEALTGARLVAARDPKLAALNLFVERLGTMAPATLHTSQLVGVIANLAQDDPTRVVMLAHGVAALYARTGQLATLAQFTGARGMRGMWPSAAGWYALWQAQKAGSANWLDRAAAWTPQALCAGQGVSV